MTHTLAKVGLLAAMATLAGCSCLKSPDLAVNQAGDSKYGDSSYNAGRGAKAGANTADVKQKFENEFVAGGLNMVYFDYDSAVIRADAETALNKFAEFAKANNVQGITLEGHADERGTREYNLALGDRRAVAMKRYLVGAGLSENQLTTISYGKERPAVEGHDENAWAKNRRGVLVLQ